MAISVPSDAIRAIPVLSPVDPTRVLFTHMVDDGALVTSTDQIRRWVQDGRAHHHLIDPTTGRAAETGLTAVIVAADSTARAEVLAKTAFVAGPERGAELLARHGADGWFVDSAGAIGRRPARWRWPRRDRRR